MFKEWKTRIEHNTRPSGVWRQLDPEDAKEQEKHELYMEIYTSKVQQAEYKLKLLIMYGIFLFFCFGFDILFLFSYQT
jgi:hypothetical protein